MQRYVIDASVAVEILLRTSIGLRLAEVVSNSLLFAPELLDVEVLSVLRRAVRDGRLSEPRAVEALHDLSAWNIERTPHIRLLRDAWSVRHNASAYDAFYVAVARVSNAALLTADGPLARASGLGVVIQNVRER